MDFKPDYDETVSWILDAYSFLSPLRSQTVTLNGIQKGYIPPSEIVTYADVFSLPVPLSEFILIVRRLDVLMLTAEAEEREHQREKTDKKEKGKK